MLEQTPDIVVLQYILTNLVTLPEEVNVERKIDEQGVLLSVKVNSKDMGILIGRNGIMASAIKTIMRAVGKSHNMNIRVQFLEPDGSLRYTTANKPTQESAEPQANASLEDDLTEFALN